jgi:hypothetical protein
MLDKYVRLMYKYDTLTTGKSLPVANLRDKYILVVNKCKYIYTSIQKNYSQNEFVMFQCATSVKNVALLKDSGISVSDLQMIL